MGYQPGGWNNGPGYYQQPPQKKNTWIYWVLGIFGFIVISCGGLLAIGFYGMGGSKLLDDNAQCSALGEAGKYKEAIPYCRAAVKRLPTLSTEHNNLGWFLCLDGQVQEGLRECQIAVDLEPREENYDSLAMAQALNNQGDEALQTEQKALNNMQEHPSRYVTLGMIYYSLNRKDEAFHT